MNVVGGDGDEAAQTGTLQNGFYAVTTFNLTAPDHPEFRGLLFETVIIFIVEIQTIIFLDLRLSISLPRVIRFQETRGQAYGENPLLDPL